MEKTGRKLTDFERAALIYHSDLPCRDKERELQKLSGSTEDHRLRGQIRERLVYDRECIRQFEEHTAGYMYAVRIHVMKYRIDEDDEICGYFSDPHAAFLHGMKQELTFDIEKYQIVGLNLTEAKKSRCFINPYLFPEKKTEELVEESEYCGMPEMVFHYDEKGVLRSFACEELPCSLEKNLELMFSPGRFENAYVDIPNPFDAGDMVKLVNGEGYGVVVTAQEEWKKYNEKMKSSETADFSDVGVTVSVYYTDGEYGEEHICTAWLERCEPGPTDRDGDFLRYISSSIREKR